MIDRLRRGIGRVDAWVGRHRTTRVWRRAIVGFLDHDALQFAGSMAYFSVLSLFQLLVLGIVVGSYLLGEGAVREWVIARVEESTPLEASTVAGIIDAAVDARSGMTIVGFVFLVWSALGIFGALSKGINRAFEDAPKRSFVMDRLYGLGLMALTGLLALGSLLVGLVTGILQRFTDEFLAGVFGGRLAVSVVGFVAPILLIFGAFWLIYRFVPNRPLGWFDVLPGAITAALLWTALRFGFTWYATSVADYESAFGPISTAITLIVFLYFASVIILLGAEIARANAVENELSAIATGDPRFLPVAEPRPVRPVQPRRLPRLAMLAGGALIGLVIGRLTKRDDGEPL